MNVLARRATWAQLNKNAVTQIVKAFYERFASRLTRKKLGQEQVGQAVPVVGIVIGARLNARLLSNLTSDAEHLYREWFLREEYSLKPIAVTVTTKGGVADPIYDVADTVHIAKIIGVTIVDDAAMDGPTCAKCGEHPAGDGGVLCPPCKQMLTARLQAYWNLDGQDVQADQSGDEVRSSTS